MLLIQIVLAMAACVGLYRLCRRQPKIVIAGFLVRALVGQALFWISYLSLPVARSLQSGNGFWFFAIDGPFYLGYATELAARGPAGIVLGAQQYPSHFFVQILSLCVAAFGSVASVAILLNCTAYLLTCAIIARVGRSRAGVVLAAIACSPASILFSTQPLKDTLFMLLIVAMVATFRRWEESWRTGSTRGWILGCALAACATLFALGGIRWYFSVIAWGAAAVLLALTALQAQQKRWAFATSAVLLVLLAQSIRLGAADLPHAYARLLNPMTALQWRPAAAREHLTVVRSGFESTPGATTIVKGEALVKPDRDSAVKRRRSPEAARASGAAAMADALPQHGPAPAPSSVASRLITGFTAMFLPRVLGESLGLIRLGGGRGLWIFAEADTLVFLLVLLYAIVLSTRRLIRGRARLTATFVFCVIVFVMTAGPLLLTVNNFGTLFRLRLMVYCVAAILPITLRHQDDAVQ